MTRKRFIKLLMAYDHVDRELANILADFGLRIEGSYAAAYECILRCWKDKAS